jgi:hypothetical protein
MRWVGHVACLGDGTGQVYTGFWQGNLTEINQFEDLHLYGRII